MKVRITARLFKGFFPKSLSVSKRFERSLRCLVHDQEEKRLSYSSEQDRVFLDKDAEIGQYLRIDSTLSCAVKDFGEADDFEEKLNAIVAEAEWRKEPMLKFATHEYADEEEEKEPDAESTDSEKTKDSA